MSSPEVLKVDTKVHRLDPARELSLIKNFDRVILGTPFEKRLENRLKALDFDKRHEVGQLDIIAEDMNENLGTSGRKKAKDDFHLVRS